MSALLFCPLLALTLEDIDFDAGTISITKTFLHVPGGGYTVNSAKTDKSSHVIEMPMILKDELKAYIDKIYKMPADARLFTHSYNWLSILLERTCEKPGVKKIRVHDIRHNHASLLINLGANSLMIAERLGHEDVSITMNTYAHLFESHKRNIMRKLENIKL